MTSILAKIEAVRSWLATQHILVEEEWLTGCVEYLCNEGSEHSQEDINRLTLDQWLLNDLKDVCPGSLPTNLATLEKTRLMGKYVLQVNCTLDIGTPAYQQYQKMKKVNTENIEETTSHEDKIPHHRIIKLFLTDGVQEICGIEYRMMRNLTCDATPGCKLLLKGPVDCRRGVLLLQEYNIEILGGEVEDLVAANNVAAVLNRLLGVQDAGVRRNNNAALLVAPPQLTTNTLRNIEQITVHVDGTNGSSNVQTNLSSRDINRLAAIAEKSSFERLTSNIQLNVSSNRPVAIVTGIPIVDSFEDDIDLDQIAAIEEQVTKHGNKRSLWASSATDRRNSAEKKLKMVPQMQNRINEFPNDDDLFQEDPFHAIFDPAPTKPVAINVPSEPFVYIKQLKDMGETERKGKIVRIKGQILKLLSKLSIGKEGWSLQCTLIDGTGSLDVQFTSRVLTKLVGYSPSEMNQMKNHMATKPEVKERVTAALNAAKMNLQVLNCVIEITFADVAKITELIPFSEEHAKLLEDRLTLTKL